MKNGLMIALLATGMMHWGCLTAVAQEVHEHQEQGQHAENGNWLAGFGAADQLQMMVQQTCPVSGQKLGSMGPPVKISVGDETAFLCCEKCKSGDISADHWKAIQTRIAAAQGTCPVMGKPVTAESESLVVNGRRVFVCCPPCGPKIQADPKTWFAKMDSSRMNSVSDQLQIEAQKICPVTGEALGSMGQPVKVQVGEETAFLCCAGCTKKQIDATHWANVQANLAAAQGKCPVMDEDLPAGAGSTVVNGRRVFVCCPPCVQKIQDEPAVFLAKINGYLMSR